MPATRNPKRAMPPSPVAPKTEPDTPAASLLAQSTSLFPCSTTPAGRRPSHHKKRPASHIPRPPNAFILFRANFIRDRHLHASSTGPLANVSPTALSTIVGITWRNLPDEERQVWTEKARLAREEHKLLYPGYRYQPLPTPEERAVSRENKRRVKEENLLKPDLERCQEISRLLVQGIRGKDLEDRVSEFDRTRITGSSTANRVPMPQPVRSSSLPTPSLPIPKAGRRPRSQSTSDSPWLPEGSVQLQRYALANASVDSYPSTPELQPCNPTGYVAHSNSTGYSSEQSLPDLIYDAASPLSINLSEPQDGITQVPGSGYGSTQSSQSQSHTLTPVANLDSTASDSYTSSFSSLTPWDNGQPPNDQLYHFPYYASSFHDDFVPQEAALPQTIMAQADQYAPAVLPFDLYHTLKPYGQPVNGFIGPSCPTHAFACEC